MKFKIFDLVKFVATGEKYIVVASKDNPWEKKNDVYMRKNIFPEHDYIIVKYISEENYLGEIDVYEHEIEHL